MRCSRSASPFARAARRVVLVLAAAIAIAGCGGLNGGTNPAAIERAHRVLDRWADTVAAAGPTSPVTLVGELTGQVGDWEIAVGDNNKMALMSGLIAAADTLSDERPPNGLVTWPDGTTTTVALLSAKQAVAAIRSRAEPCPDCTAPLLVTAARLRSLPIETTRGTATGPVWEFTIGGTAVKVTRVALADPVVVVPLFDADPQIGLAIDSVQAKTGGTELTVGFVGAPDPGNQPCGEDYTAEAVESDLAVVVIVTRHPHFPPFGGGCTAVGAPRTATATLAAPLGERAVLDLQRGTPLPIDLSP